MELSHRIQSVKPSPTLEITAKAAALKAQGHDVIDLGAGEPDFDTPDFVKDAAKAALDAGKTKYTAADGMPLLKQAIAAKFARENDISYGTDQISVGNGAKQILFNAFYVTLNPGDEVIIPAPYWVSYPDMVLLCGGTPVIISATQESDFKITPAQLAAALTPRTKWIVLNSPSNPTGAVYTPEELSALMDVVRNHPHVYVMADDIYEHLVYGGVRFTTPAQVAPDLVNRILTINGVSKSHAMTGWRIGFCGGPKDIITAMRTLMSQTTSNPCSIAQEAAFTALNGNQSFLAERNTIFQERRDYVVFEMNKIPGLSCLLPYGAFYVYPSCAGVLGKRTIEGFLIRSDRDFASYLLDSANVAVVPGVAFGLSPHFRISYATSMDNLKTACRRIYEACARLV